MSAWGMAQKSLNLMLRGLAAGAKTNPRIAGTFYPSVMSLAPIAGRRGLSMLPRHQSLLPAPVFNSCRGISKQNAWGAA